MVGKDGGGGGAGGGGGGGGGGEAGGGGGLVNEPPPPPPPPLAQALSSTGAITTHPTVMQTAALRDRSRDNSMYITRWAPASSLGARES